jgi:hypothetical protein
MDNVNSIEQQQQQQITTGQQLGSQEQQQANQQSALYNTSYQNAQQAAQNVSSYADYLKNQGSGSNIYNQSLQTAYGQTGYDPAAMQKATQNYIQSQNALANVNQASQSSGGGYGLTGDQLAGRYASLTQPLQTQVTGSGNAINAYNTLATNALGLAQNLTAAQLKSQEDTQTQLQNAYTAASGQANQALTAMNNYATLAQKQQGLTQDQLNNFYDARAQYESSIASAAAAANSYAQAGLAAAGTRNANLLTATTAIQQNRNINAKQLASLSGLSVDDATAILNLINTVAPPPGGAINNSGSYTGTLRVE